MSNHKTRDWLFVLAFAGVAGSLGAAHREKEVERAGGRPPPCAAHPSLTDHSGIARSISERDICRVDSVNSNKIRSLLQALSAPETSQGAPVGEQEFRALLRRNGDAPPSPDDLHDIVHHERNLAFTRKERSALEGLIAKGGVEEGVALIAANATAFSEAEAHFGVAPKDVAAVLVAQKSRPPTGGGAGVSTFNALFARLLFMDLEIDDAVYSGALTRNHPLASARADAARMAAAEGLPVLLRYAKKTGVDPLKITGRLPGTVGPWALETARLGSLQDGNGDGKADPEELTDVIATTAALMAEFGSAQDRASTLRPFNYSGYSAKLVIALGDRIGWKLAGGMRARPAGMGVMPAAAAAPHPTAPPPLPAKLAEHDEDESGR